MTHMSAPSPAPAAPGPPTPAPLSLAVLGAGGLRLRGTEAAYWRGNAPATYAPALGHLFEAGVLPHLPPKRRESLPAYLRRLALLPMPWEEHYRVRVSAYHPSPRRAAEDPLRAPRCGGELALSVGSDVQPATFSARALRRSLDRLHPRFFGSVMVHVSRVTRDVWPVLGAADALDLAHTLHFDYGLTPGFGGFWHDVQRELRGDTVRSPTRREVVTQARRRWLTPRELFRRIGVNEVLPALKPHLCFSLPELRALARTDRYVLDLLDLIGAVGRINHDLRLGLSPADHAGREAYGERRVQPYALISGQQRFALDDENGWYTHGYLHDLHELVTEELQTLGSPYMPNLLLRVFDLPSARRAPVTLERYRQSMTLTDELIDQLVC